MEPTPRNESMAATKGTAQGPRYSFTVHSIRKRTVDFDGVSAKAAIDAIVKCGIIPDDSYRYCKEITYTQEKGSEDKTIITIKEVDG